MSSQEDKKTLKRKNVISWEEYFMGVAIWAAKRSKDPAFQVGACIVNDDTGIVGIGYNGMPKGCSDDTFPWDKKEKHLYVCHSELNAIVNSLTNVKNCTMYVTLFPCSECAKFIIQSGIKKIVYLTDSKAEKEEFKASRRMFNAVNIELEHFKTKRAKMEIDFSFDGTSKSEEED